MISLPYFDQRQSDPLLKQILSATREAVVVEGRDGRVIAINARFLELIGWTEPYSGQRIDDLLSAWTARVAHPQSLESYFRSCRSDAPPEGSVELQPNPGQVIEARFLPVKMPDGSRQRLWFFQEWKTSALAWVSHEIKNPLNAVLGFSELLHEALAGGPMTDIVKDSLRGLRVGGKHLQSVLGDLLDLSRLESGVVEPHPAWTSLPLFLEDLEDLFQTRFRRRGLDFQVIGPQEPALDLWLDPGRLSQILGNLLSNALRFTKRGWVILRVSRLGEAWEFVVEDSGVGIPADQQKTIFEPFVQKQGQDSQKFGGTGLGLAICRTLAQSLGARLALESQPGSGSRFSLVFDHMQVRPTVPAVAATPGSPFPGTTLLVADDERSNHMLIQGFLRQTPFTILSAHDGHQAIELWKAHHPQLVLMDLRMPGLSGTDAGQRIRSLDPTGATRLLAMSATPLSGVDVQDGESLWSGFLEKPFQKGDFLKFLSNHLPK